jgi:hypothetical protein
MEEIKSLLDCYGGLSFSIPLIERQRILREITIFLGNNFNLPIYLWNLSNNGYQWLQFNQETMELDYSLLVDFSDSYLTPFQQGTEALSFVYNYERKGIFILENIQSLMKRNGQLGEGEVLSSWLVNTIYSCQMGEVGNKEKNELCYPQKYLILLDTNEVELPENLSAIIPSYTLPLPTAEEITKLMQSLLPNNSKISQELLLAVSGLTLEEIKIGFKLKGVGNREWGIEENIDKKNSSLIPHPSSLHDSPLPLLLDYKISRLQSLGLEFIPQPDVIDVGGLDRLKLALEGVKIDFSEDARKYKIPLPKGWLLAGPPGTGKTFSAKVCAKKLGFPLINVGIDTVKMGGATHFKRLLKRIEAASPCVCYFDEFDKFFMANNTSSEDSETKQILGVLLTWLQEKQSPTFVIATLNRLDALPPELTRAGRFDKIFYVGFPQAIERKQIFQLHGSKYDERYKDDSALNYQQWQVLLGKTQNCTGAEIRAIVETAVKKCFHQGREILLELEELLAARELITPLYIRDTERVLAMENRAKGIAEPASSLDTSEYAPVATSLWGD